LQRIHAPTRRTLRARHGSNARIFAWFHFDSGTRCDAIFALEATAAPILTIFLDIAITCSTRKHTRVARIRTVTIATYGVRAEAAGALASIRAFHAEFELVAAWIGGVDLRHAFTGDEMAVAEVACVDVGADRPVRAGAHAVRARVDECACIVVITRRSVWRGYRFASSSIGWIAISRSAGITGAAHLGITPGADASIARIGQGTGIAVAARSSIGSVRIRAEARHGIAYAGHMAWVERRTNDWVSRSASPRLAGVAHAASIAVGARSAVELRERRALARGREADGIIADITVA